MNNRIFSLVLFILLGCSQEKKNQSGNFLNHFYECTKDQLVNDLITPLNNKGKILSTSEYELLNYFLIPVDEFEFKNSHTPNSKNKYQLLYKCKLDEKHYLVSYVEHYGYMTDHTQYLCLYDLEKDKIVSKLTILNSPILKSVKNAKYNGEIFSTTISYGINLERGIDTKHPEKSFKVVTQNYELNSKYFFERIK